MSDNNKIQLFEDKKLRTYWDENEMQWYFSVIDVCEILAEASNPRRYWSDLKRKLKSEGSEVYEKIVQLKMPAEDGKMRMTDCCTTEQLLRLVQSIPSKNAEPFKMWLASVGNERLDEIADPEIAIDRAFDTYFKKGYSEKWINQRIKTMEVRKEYTDELQAHGVAEQKDFAILTNEITQAWSGKSVKEYKRYKGLKKENLRDHMTNVELILNMLAEATATDLTRDDDPRTMDEHKKIAQRGGSVAKAARLQYEEERGKPAVSPLNAKNLKKLRDKDNDEEG